MVLEGRERGLMRRGGGVGERGLMRGGGGARGEGEGQ